MIKSGIIKVTDMLVQNIILNIILAVTSGVVVALINHFLTNDRKRNEEEREMKIKAYSSLLDSARAFLDDPNLPKKERREIKRQFLQKYYNEIILFADKEVQDKIEGFISTGGVSATNPGNQVTKLKDMIISIRKDLNFHDSIPEDFKMYSLDVEEERD